jgi:hypothetical protein
MTTEDLYVLGGSAAVVLVMIGAAAVLGFRQLATLDEAEMVRLAAAEGAEVDAVAIDAKGRNAIARLAGGKLLVARVMADGVSARVAAPQQLRVRLRRDRISARFGDVGFPPLTMQLAAPPAWLAELAGDKS